MFRGTPVVTLRSSVRTFRLKLWDTETESLVPFPGRRARSRDLGGRDWVAPVRETTILARGEREPLN
jgi:hypothetical protein